MSANNDELTAQKEWLQKRSSTIWIDEVSDINGRLAIICSPIWYS